MDTTVFNHLTTKASRAIKSWWLLLIAGILGIAAGIAAFCYPMDSYVALSIIIGVVLLVMGVVELAVALTSRNLFLTRGYNIAGGILDILLGIMLCSMPGITMVTLPIFLGVCLIYHSFMIIGFGSDLAAFNVPGRSWCTLGGVLMLIVSIFMVLKPFDFGASVIVALLGCALIVFGAVMIAMSIKLHKLHGFFQEYKEEN